MDISDTLNLDLPNIKQKQQTKATSWLHKFGICDVNYDSE